MSEYPEHDKLRLIIDNSQEIGEFLDWLGSKGIFLAQYDMGTHPHNENDLVFVSQSIHVLLADYFEIDSNELEKEKRDMLNKIRGGI